MASGLSSPVEVQQRGPRLLYLGASSLCVINSGVLHTGVPLPAATSFSGELLAGSPPNLPPTHTHPLLLPLPKLPPPHENGKQVSHHPRSFWDSNPGRAPRGFLPGSSGSGTAGSQYVCPQSAERRAKVPEPGSPDAWSCRDREREERIPREGEKPWGILQALFPPSAGDLAEAQCPAQAAYCVGPWPLRPRHCCLPCTWPPSSWGLFLLHPVGLGPLHRHPDTVRQMYLFPKD